MHNVGLSDFVHVDNEPRELQQNKNLKDVKAGGGIQKIGGLCK